MLRSILILSAGLLTAASQIGIGVRLLRWLRVSPPKVWEIPVGFLVGLQATALAVELLASARVGTHAFAALWIGETIVGAILFAREAEIPHGRLWAAAPRACRALLAVAGAALAINLLIALAPSTKIDEIYYHMLLPQRIAAGGEVRFYLEPWDAAILPQMTYQIAATPLHALKLGDAMNVVSWTLGLLLVFFPVKLLSSERRLTLGGCLISAGIAVGMYSAVQFVTGGSHAETDLAIVLCTIASCRASRLSAECGPRAFAVMISLTALAAASGKISALPLAVALMFWGLYRGLAPHEARERLRSVSLAVVPWIVFYLPIVAWTYVHSGAPFGPIYSWYFPNSIYDSGTTKQFFESIRQVNHLPLREFLSAAIVQFSPLIWIAALAMLVSRQIERIDRIAMAILLALQCALVALRLPTQVRFLSGFQFGLAIVFAVQAQTNWARFTRRNAIAAVSIVFLAPWLLMQAYYARPFVAVTTGIEPRTRFLEQYVAFYDDFAKLDQLLPQKSTLLIRGFRAGSFYAPRNAFQDLEDLPLNRAAYSLGPDCSDHARFSIHGRTEEVALGAPVFVDSMAVIKTYRTPGKAPVHGLVCVQPVLDR